MKYKNMYMDLYTECVEKKKKIFTRFFWKIFFFTHLLMT